MTNTETVEILKALKPEHLGFGEPSLVTKMLEAEGLIQIHEKKIEGREYWYASLTRHGQRFITNRGKPVDGKKSDTRA